MLIKSYGEFSFLPKSLAKGVELPNLIFFEGMIEVSGFYRSDEQLIAISDYWEEDVPATIAHEFCHHLQHSENRLSAPVAFNGDNDYEEEIESFYKDKCEREALMFEYKHSCTQNNEYQLKSIVLPDKALWP